MVNADERGGKQVQITGGDGGTEGGPGAGYVAYVFVFLGGIIICPMHKLTLPHQAQLTVKSFPILGEDF